MLLFIGLVFSIGLTPLEKFLPTPLAVNFKVITLRGTSGGIHLRAQTLEEHQNTLFRHLKNGFFSRNLGKICIKMRIFRKNTVKLPQRPGAPPQAPVGLRRLRTPPPTPRVVTPNYCYRFVEVRF